MTNIYEALQQAAKEGKSDYRKQFTVIHPRFDPLRVANPDVQEKMINLYRSIQSQLADDSGFVIHLLEIYKANGAMSLVREFAKTLALKLEKKVLLLDTTPGASQLTSLGIVPKYSWKEAFRDNKSIRAVIYQIEDSNLFGTQLSRDINSITQVIESPKTTQYLEELRQIFHVILINSPPGITSTDSLALSGKSDGVIILIEAEKTRWRVAKKLKEDIESHGGHIIGTVLSEKRYHIPQFIYDRL